MGLRVVDDVVSEARRRDGTTMQGNDHVWCIDLLGLAEDRMKRQ